MTTTTRPRPKIMSLTDAAAERITQIMRGKPGAQALKLGVTKGGCAGMEYTMDWVYELGPGDDVVEDKGVKLVIEPLAVMYLLGTEMDYTVDKLSSGFVFNNPNQQSACGCGESVELAPASAEQLAALKES